MEIYRFYRITNEINIAVQDIIPLIDYIPISAKSGVIPAKGLIETNAHLRQPGQLLIKLIAYVFGSPLSVFFDLRPHHSGNYEPQE